MKKALIGFIILLIVLALLFIPVIHTEYITHMYYDEFSDFLYSHELPIHAERFKIIDHSDDEATVYFYTPYVSGDILCFTKHEGCWSYTSWETYWSYSGSADKLVWPYWWHFIYFLVK